MKKRQGFALLTVLFIVLVFAVVGTGLVYMFFTESKLSVGEHHYNQAFYIAEAGRNFALKHLNAYAEWSASMGFPLTKSFGGGHFSVTASNVLTASITLTSTGIITVEGRTYSRAVRADVARDGGGVFGGYGIYSYGSSSGDDVTNIGSNAQINGSIFTNADLYLNSNVTVNGDATSTGSITEGSGVNVTGETASAASPLDTVPSLDASYYDSQLLSAAATTAANVTYSGTTTLSGYRYVNGNVTISNNARIYVTGTATVVATGVVNVANNVIFGNNLTVIAAGAITIQNNVDIGQSGLWYSSTSITAGNNAEIGTVTVATGTIFLSPGDVALNNNCIFYGFVFSGDTLTIGANANITGTLVANFIDSIGSNARFNFSSSIVDYISITGLSNITSLGSITITNWEEVY